MEKSVKFTGACENEIIPSMNRLFVYKTKAGRHLRIFLLRQISPFNYKTIRNKIYFIYKYDYVIKFVSQFFPGSPVSSTNKTDRHVITEILFKVALSTISKT
jgi:hypothetical protein